MFKWRNNINWFIFYYLGIALSVLMITVLIVILFINQINVNNYICHENDKLFFGFYELTVHTNKPNDFNVNWLGILFSILVIIIVGYLCFNFYWYKWSKFNYYFKKYELAILYGLLILFILFLYVLNFMNRNIINLKEVNLINNSWISDVPTVTTIRKFNFVYDLNTYKVNNVVYKSLLINNFGIFWIVINVLFILITFGLFIKIEIYKNKYLLCKNKKNRNIYNFFKKQ